MIILQFGSTMLGLATTIPALAPGAFTPFEPMLFKIPCSAIGLSADKYSSIVAPRGDSLGCPKIPAEDRSQAAALLSHQH